MPHLSILGNKSKKYCYICHQHPQSKKFHGECKKFQFGAETAFFRLTLKKTIDIFEIATLEFAEMQKYKSTKA